MYMSMTVLVLVFFNDQAFAYKNCIHAENLFGKRTIGGLFHKFLKLFFYEFESMLPAVLVTELSKP